MATTLLQLVQDVLNEMDSDAINTLTDTQEADQIAHLTKSIYDEMVVEFDFPHTMELIQLTALGDASYPNYMQFPASVSELGWIQYKNADGDYKKVEYLTPLDFLDIIMGRDTSLSEVDEITDHSGVTLKIRNDKQPTYWTSFNDDHIVFDSYDSTVDSTLQASKSMAHVYTTPTIAIADGTVIDIPDNLLPLLKQEVLARSFVNFKQTQNPKAEMSARRMRVRSQRNKSKKDPVRDWPNYGRK